MKYEFFSFVTRVAGGFSKGRSWDASGIEIHDLEREKKLINKDKSLKEELLQE